MHVTANGKDTDEKIWLSPGQDIQANIHVTNSGPATADDVWGHGEIYMMPSDPNKPEVEKTEEKKKDMQILIPRFKKALAEAAKTSARGTMLYSSHDDAWFTAHSEGPVSQGDIAKLASGAELLFLFYSIQYSDPAGSHYIHACRGVQSPAFNPEVWQFCFGFQDHR
jgi:hypothetical protein